MIITPTTLKQNRTFTVIVTYSTEYKVATQHDGVSGPSATKPVALIKDGTATIGSEVEL